MMQNDNDDEESDDNDDDDDDSGGDGSDDDDDDDDDDYDDYDYYEYDYDDYEEDNDEDDDEDDDDRMIMMTTKMIIKLYVSIVKVERRRQPVCPGSFLFYSFAPASDHPRGMQRTESSERITGAHPARRGHHALPSSPDRPPSIHRRPAFQRYPAGLGAHQSQLRANSGRRFDLHASHLGRLSTPQGYRSVHG